MNSLEIKTTIFEGIECRAEQATCKICGKALCLYIAVESTPEWNRVFLPMATCNPCADMLRDRQAAEGQIYRACITLMRAGKKIDSDTLANLRKILEVATKKYATAISNFHRTDKWLWNLDFVSQLVEAPENIWLTLWRYRKACRDCFDTPTLNPQDRPEFKKRKGAVA